MVTTSFSGAFKDCRLKTTNSSMTRPRCTALRLRLTDTVVAFFSVASTTPLMNNVVRWCSKSPLKRSCFLKILLETTSFNTFWTSDCLGPTEKL